MKKFTFLMIALLSAVVSFAAGPKKHFSQQLFTPAKTLVQLRTQLNAKPAPEGLVMKATKASAKKMRAPKKAVAGADIAGDYTWDYETVAETTLALDTMETTAGSARITIAATEREDSVIISGMSVFDDIYAHIVSEEGTDYLIIPHQLAYNHSQVGTCSVTGFFYYEGDETYEEGWYFGGDIVGVIGADGVITFGDTFINMVVDEGQYAGYTLLKEYFAPGSTFTPADPLTVVTLPAGVEMKEYAMTYTDYYSKAASGSAFVGIDGNDVYVQGFSSYIPDALIKGTMDGNTVTFPGNQYLGNYSGMDDFFMEEAVFTYDAETDTYTATGDVYSVLGGKYIDVWATDPVLKGVVEKAAMPANPEITGLTNSQYGWYIDFNVPNVDVNGDGLVSSKLSYIIYTDIEGEIAPLTFTPATHTHLADDMTEIPFGFTEAYDFYDNQIYLNDLYSADWNQLGIQSIYRGGGEENVTEIQWYHIKDYAAPATGDFTFNFNEMDVPTSSNVSTDGNITEDKTITEGNVSLTISPSTTSTPNRFWGTGNGPQLRVYGGTLTFEVPEGNFITAIDFSNNVKWNEGNSADSGEFDGTTWTGKAQTVVVTIAGNTQLNAITVTVEGEGGEQPVVEDVLVTLPDGVESEAYTLNISQYAWNGEEWANISSVEDAQVAFDGTDVYVSGLAYFFKDAFVKGEMNADGQVVFKSGQFVGEDEYGKEYLVGATFEGENEVISDFVFNYDAEARTLTLAEGYILLETDSPAETASYTYADAAVYTPGAIVLPDVVELPDGAEANDWYLAAFDSEKTVVNRTVGVAFDGDDIYVQGLCDYLPEAWVKGTIDAKTATATFPSGQFYGTFKDSYNLFFVGSDGQTAGDVVFDYDAEKGTLTTETYIMLAGDGMGVNMYDYYSDVVISRDKPETFPVEAPADLETETYLFTANVVDADAARRAGQGTDVTFDFNAMDVAVSDNNGGTDGDITETLELTEGGVKLTVSPKEEGKTTENRFWGTDKGPQLRIYSGTLTFSAPEGSMLTQIVFNNGKWNEGNAADSGSFDGATWTGNAQTVVVNIAGNTQINNIVVTLDGENGEETADEPDYSFQIQVGFDGNDVYFSGMNEKVTDMWMKGTLGDDGKTVTIPACQYMGQYSIMGFAFDYFITAQDEDGNFADIVLNYDAEAQTFTTAQTVVLNGYKDEWDPYQTFTNVVIAKMQEFAATPADPILEAFNLDSEVGYSTIYAQVPTEDVDGNPLMTSKLFYIVWIEKDGKQQPFTFLADLYSYDFEEDMTEIPYNYDGYDIYKGGEIIYLEESLEELATWTKVGIQSVYYGGGERNVSNVVWKESSLYTGIAEVAAKADGKNAVIFDMQGRRVAKPAKGLYIVNGKKVVLK